MRVQAGGSRWRSTTPPPARPCVWCSRRRCARSTELLASWVFFPLCLAGLSLGIGLLLERVADLRLPGPLLVPAGLAGAIVLALPLTLAGATAELIAPVVAGAGIAGLALLPGRSTRPDPTRWAAPAWSSPPT